MPDITIDQGNSSVKIAVWDGTNLLDEETLPRLDAAVLARIVDRYRPARALCCSVTGNGSRIAAELGRLGVDAREL